MPAEQRREEGSLLPPDLPATFLGAHGHWQTLADSVPGRESLPLSLTCTGGRCLLASSGLKELPSPAIARSLCL